MKTREGSGLLAGCGLFAGAIAWSLHQQISYIASSWICGRDTALMVAVFVFTAALLSVGIVLSRRAGSSLPAENRAPDNAGRPRQFLVSVSFLAGGLFLFAIILQTAAAFFLPGCR